MWLAWHVNGMSWSEFLELTGRERRAISDALEDRIEQHNEAAKPQANDKGF